MKTFVGGNLCLEIGFKSGKNGENAVKISLSAALRQKLHIETPTDEQQKKTASSKFEARVGFFYEKIQTGMKPVHREIICRN